MNGSAGDPAGSSEPKPWERAWSTDEMRQNAHAWNLAGDTGLLKYLQEFSQSVVAHTHTTEKALDTLAEEISTLTSDINTTNNKFLCLANTQFVENRVYEDDDKETPQDESPPKNQSKEETDTKMLQKVREALSLSVAVLDTMFEPVEIQASDSEGESEMEQQRTKTLLLEPHNPYIHRPLPHLIGSEAFMSDDHIGLADSPSDEEDQSHKTGVDYDMDASSDSDNDFPPIRSNKRKMDMYSSRSSVSTEHEKISRQIEPVNLMQGAGNTSNDTEPHAASSIQNPAQDNSFASQLAAKLDKIASPATVAKKISSDNLFGGVLSENEDDTLFSGNSGLFSGRPKLFDDLEDTNNSLWGPDEVTARNAAPESQQFEQATKISSKPDANNLFSSNGSDDEDSLFSIAKSGKTIPPKPRPHLVSPEMPSPGIFTSTPDRGLKESSEKRSRATSTVIDESHNTNTQVDADLQPSKQSPINPAVNRRETSYKKLAGAVPMFGKDNVLEGLKAKLPQRPSSSSSESLSSDPAENSMTRPADKIFDEVNEYYQENGSSSSFQKRQGVSEGFLSPAPSSTSRNNNQDHNTKEEPCSNLNIPSTSNDDIDDIFGTKSSTYSHSYSAPISGGLFADVDDEEDDLFAVSPAPKQEEKKEIRGPSEKHVISNLLKEEKKNPSNSTEDAETVQQITSKPSQTIIAPKSASGKSFTHDIYSTVPPPLKSENKAKKPVSLFDDSDSGEDELLFSSASSAGSRRSQASTDILSAAAASSVEKKSLSKKGLFDDDDALFGNSYNDPDIDIFGLSKSATDSKPIVGDTKEKSEPALKAVFQDSSSKSDRGNLVSSEPSLFKSNLFDTEESDDVESDIFREISVDSTVHNVETVSSNDSYIKPKELGGNPSVEPRSTKASLAVENEIESQKKQILNEKIKHEKSLSIKDESSPEITVNTQHRKPEPPRTLNIRKETDPGLGLFDESNDEDDDLFNSSWKKETEKPPPRPEESFKPKTSAKPVTAVKPTVALGDTTSVKKLDIPQASMEPSSETVDVADGAAVSVSKLRNSLLGGNGQPSLKIDPRALLPGQKPPPRRTPPKEEKPDPESTVLSPGPKEIPAWPMEKSVGFDQPTLSNATLSSVNKDRAKLGVKRRPPSNKARREAARASQNLDQSDRESPLSPDALSIWADSIGGGNSNGNSNNSVLSPSTDEDDLFGVPQDLPAEYENPSSSAVNIFSSPPILSPVVPVNHDSKPEKAKFTDQVKEFQDSLQKNASLFLPPDIDDDNLSEKLFEPIIDTAPVVDETLVVDTTHVFDEVPVVGSTSLLAVEPISEAHTTLVANTSSVDCESEKIAITDDDASVKTVDPPEVPHQNSMLSSDSTKSVHRKDSTAPVVDPLNKEERTSINQENDLFGNDTTEIVDDHSALFPFVKKKLDSKPSSNQPLFSQTPILPSKTDKSAPKPDLGGLDEVEDNDLFSSANLKSQISSKKTPIPQNKEVKTWNFSDEDDDDLFQTGAKNVQMNPSQNASSTNKGKSLTPEPFVSEKNSKPVKPSHKPSNGLFSDENDDDDLFSKPSKLLKKKVKETNSTKPSLFEDDDDDLFGSKQPKPLKNPNPKKLENVPGSSVQPQASSKVKKDSVFDDPLKVFQND